jgi:hypothetical protein
MRRERETEFIGVPLHERWEFRSELDNDIYSLLSLFASSNALAKIASDKKFIEPMRSIKLAFGHNYFDQLQRQFFVSRATKLLVDIALSIRCLDDLEPASLSPNSKQLICGEIELPVDTPKKPLTLREACNKIIHSSEIVFEQQRQKYSVKENKARRRTYNVYFSPSLAINGKLGASEWHATTDVFEFCRCCLEFRELRAF